MTFEEYMVALLRQATVLAGDPHMAEDIVQDDAAPGGEDVIPTVVRIMEEFDFGPWPDLSWIGKR